MKYATPVAPWQKDPVGVPGSPFLNQSESQPKRARLASSECRGGVRSVFAGVGARCLNPAMNSRTEENLFAGSLLMATASGDSTSGHGSTPRRLNGTTGAEIMCGSKSATLSVKSKG